MNGGASGGKGPCSVKAEALKLLTDGGSVPELIVLDLDYTVWRVFVDSLAGPPFRFCEERQMVVDRRNWEVEIFPEVPALLQAFREANVKVALASRTEEPAWAEEVINMFKIHGDDVLVDFTHAQEIYPTSKERHFRELSRKMNVDLSRMLFFDDERRNITEVSRLNVTCIHCDDGLNLAALQKGLQQFRSRHRAGHNGGAR